MDVVNRNDYASFFNYFYFAIMSFNSQTGKSNVKLYLLFSLCSLFMPYPVKFYMLLGIFTLAMIDLVYSVITFSSKIKIENESFNVSYKNFVFHEVNFNSIYEIERNRNFAECKVYYRANNGMDKYLTIYNSSFINEYLWDLPSVV